MKNVKISWGPIQCECDTCICQTLVSYREQGSPTWTTPAGGNPTQNNYFNLTIVENVYYQARVRFIGPRCKQKDSFITLYFPSAGCCPSDYTMSPDASYCYKTDDIDATPPSGSVLNLVAAPFSNYSAYGSYIYNTGYNINGTGTSTQIPVSNGFWVNGPGDGGNHSFSAGPLNRAGVWASTTSDNQDIGFGICLSVDQTATYYAGIGSDNYAIIKVDGTVIVQQDATALGTQYGSDVQITFKIWHIYPIILTAGPHIIELIGHNVSSNASIGAELYAATPSQLIAATSYADLGDKLLFSSKDQIGHPAQIGSQNAGYTCPDGYALAACTSPVKCRRILHSDPITC